MPPPPELGYQAENPVSLDINIKHKYKHDPQKLKIRKYLHGKAYRTLT